MTFEARQKKIIAEARLRARQKAADSARLDWLEAQYSHGIHRGSTIIAAAYDGDDLFLDQPREEVIRGKDVRDLLDNAMKERPVKP